MLLRKARNFARQPAFVRAWFLPTWLLLGLSRALVLVVPFRRFAPWMGEAAGVASRVPLLDAEEEARALLVGKVVLLAAAHSPWEANCFATALAARALLGLHRIPYALHMGVAKDAADGGLMKAHAWVVAGRVRVTGGEGFDRYVVVGCFVGPATPPPPSAPASPAPGRSPSSTAPAP